jgi:2-(1,2-epoxy-1,2-dihydrophenyl)acetyl-CoA isomerase
MADIEFSKAGGIARITINRPAARNACSTAMWSHLSELAHDVEQDRSIRCLLIAGAGEHFCAGGDLKEFATTLPLSTEERARFWAHSSDVTNGFFLVMERMPQPVVVSVRGHAAGGGLAIVAAADLAIVSDTAKFLAAQIKIGAIPDSGVSYNLVRSIGLKRAKQLGMLGELIDARTALDIGLVNWVVPDGELESRTEKLLAGIAEGPATALALTKRAFNDAWTASLADHYVQEARDVADCVRDPEYDRLVRAFLGRRR